MYKFGCPVLKTKLDFGDYSAQCELPSGVPFSLADKAAIERKQNLTELAGNLSTSRDRFKREFERAQAADAKLYLLVEQATWEKAYTGQYRSKMKPNALTASMTTWMVAMTVKSSCATPIPRPGSSMMSSTAR